MAERRMQKQKNDFRNKDGRDQRQKPDFRNKEGGEHRQKPDFRNKEGGEYRQKPDFRSKEGGEHRQKPDFRNKEGGEQRQKPDFRNKDSRDQRQKPDFRNKDSRVERKAPITHEKRGEDIFERVDIHDELDKLEGRNSVMEALKAGRTINKILVSSGEREGSIRQIIAVAREKGIVVQEVERAKLDSLTSTGAHQGVIAFVAVKDYVEIDDILEAAQEKGEPPFIVILDEITDPHNLGSIMRTADAAGAHGIVIPKRRAIGLTASVSKASAGAVEYVPVARVTNIAQTIEYLKKQNVWVVGTDTSGEKTFYESDLKGPIALVIGSEGEGIGKLIKEKCDFVVNIPMKGKISSLNASVASAIVMYEILKQRSK